MHHYICAAEENNEMLSFSRARDSIQYLRMRIKLITQELVPLQISPPLPNPKQF